jgi:hypothetical protein
MAFDQENPASVCSVGESVPIETFLDPGRLMGKRKLPISRRGASQSAYAGKLVCQHAPQQSILFHRKSVSLGQGQYKMIAIKGLHRFATENETSCFAFSAQQTVAAMQQTKVVLHRNKIA